MGVKFWVEDFCFLQKQNQLISPVTGRSLKNPQNLSNKKLAEEHLAYLSRKNKKMKILPFWFIFIEASSYYPKDAYHDFISLHLKDWINQGYSDSLLTLPAV